METSDERVRRLCYQRSIFGATNETRTHSHSHPSIKNICVNDDGDGRLLECFHEAVAGDIENGVRQSVGEWLGPRFVFFLEVHAHSLPDEAVRLELGRFFAREIGQFNVVPSAILVLGWHGHTPNVFGLRLRFIFQGVVTDRERAVTMHNFLLERAHTDLEGAARSALAHNAPRVQMSSDWRKAIPHDVYLKSTGGERGLIMVGSYSLQPCIGPGSHARCPSCLGTRFVGGNAMPFSLLHVLDYKGHEHEDPSKIGTLEIVRRTQLRTDSQLTESWVEPAHAPATLYDVGSGQMLSSYASESASRRGNKNRLTVTNPTHIETLTTIIRRHLRDGAHAGVYRDLRVDKALRGFRNGRLYFTVHPVGCNDRWCANKLGLHVSASRPGRIAFEVTAEGAAQICFCHDPSLPEGKVPCREYKQRPDLHPLSAEEKRTLGFPVTTSAITSGSTMHQLLNRILPTLQAELNGARPAKRKR